MASTTTDGLGNAKVVFTKPFAAPPALVPLPFCISGQMYLPTVPGPVTRTGATVNVQRTKGTLLLTASAIEPAPGVTAPFLAIGS